MSRKELKEFESLLQSGDLDAEKAAALNPDIREKLNEYYNLDYEDIVGGIPTRFKYREVLANDFCDWGIVGTSKQNHQSGKINNTETI